ncbi:MAG: ankyrin repeat domain-containing protein [Gammaproteobacteria bacterium]
MLRVYSPVWFNWQLFINSLDMVSPLNIIARFFLAIIVLAVSSFPINAQSLLDAARKGDADQIKSLVSNKADINTTLADGTSALAWVVYNDEVGSVDLLLRAGANVNSANDLGVTPLSLACENGNAIIVSKLLQAGADPNITKVTGVTPLMLCANMGVTAAVRDLIKKGADVNASENNENQTALMWATAERHPQVVKLIVDAGGNVNATSRIIPEPKPYIIDDENLVFGRNYPVTIRFPEFTGGFTALYFAAQQNDMESARILLDAGADINAANKEYGTPLIIALTSGHEDMARYLLDNGANPNVKDGWGITPLHYALHKGVLVINTFKPSTTDRFGWERTNMPNMVRALLDKGADPEARIEYSLPYHNDAFFSRSMEDPPQVDPVGATPLLLAAVSGDVESMKILINHGANKNARTIGGGTLFMLAAGMGSEKGTRDQAQAIEAAKFSLLLGADINVYLTDIAAVGPGKGMEDGRTALHHAVYLGWTDMIKFLVKNGANIHAKDRYGMTPMLIAMGDPEGRLYRNIGSGNSDSRFRTPPPIESKKLSSLLLELGAEPFTGTFRDRSGE